MELNRAIDSMRDQIVRSTQELVKIRSIEGIKEPLKPFGKDVAACLEKALVISNELGFKTVNLDGYVGYAEYGEGEDYIGVLGHLDIVPEGDGWIYPPYAAEIHDNKIYGRGTMDDKGPIVAALYGLKAIKDLGLKLSKRVRIIFGTNEETGCHEMEHYLKVEKPPVAGFTPDAQYPIIYAEKGITMFEIVKDLKLKPKGLKIKYIKGGNRPNMVPDYCEAGIEIESSYRKNIIKEINQFAVETGFKISAEEKDGLFVLKSFGVSAHGSLPELGKNAIMQMFAALSQIELPQCDIADFIDFMNKNVGFETDGKSFGVYLEDEPSGKLTFNVGVVNMEEDKITMGLNLRYPVTYKYDDMMDLFNKKIEGTGIKVEKMTAHNPLYFPKEHPLIKTLQKVYTDQTGKEATLLAIGGGTYAKEMPNIVAFGPIFPGQEDLDHKANEYIDIDNLMTNAKIYAHAIYELAK